MSRQGAGAFGYRPSPDVCGLTWTAECNRDDGEAQGARWEVIVGMPGASSELSAIQLMG